MKLVFETYVPEKQHVPRRAITQYLSVTTMNYIKRLQADKADALAAARLIETEINHLISYLSCSKFHVDAGVQVSDVLRDILPMKNNVTYLAATLSNGGTNDKNK